MKIEIEVKDSIAERLVSLADREMRTVEAQVAYIVSKAVIESAVSGAKGVASEKRIIELCRTPGGITKGVLMNRMRGTRGIDKLLAELVSDGRIKVIPSKRRDATRLIAETYQETR